MCRPARGPGHRATGPGLGVTPDVPGRVDRDRRLADLPDPHSRAAGEVAQALGVDPERGLRADEAAARLGDWGPNELAPPERPTLVAMLWEALTEPFILVLIGAGALAVILGEVRDGLLILVGVVPIVGADVATTYRAERALEALRLASAPVARVRRDGQPVVVPAREVVPGDVALLSSGDVVPADGRVVASHGAMIDRSVLTGESIPESSEIGPDAPGSALAERRSMVYAGTSLVAGSAEAVIVATGPNTEVGRIARSLGAPERRRSPIQLELDRLVRILLVVASALVAITVGLGFLRGNPPGQNLLAGIAAAIAAVPEEPPVLLAVILGLGAYRLLRRGVLVRRLNAQETLGAVDLILTDKTGTLTHNRLEVAGIYTPHGRVAGGPPSAQALADALRAEVDAWRAERLGSAGAFPRALRRALEAEGDAPRLAPSSLIRAEPPAQGHPYSLVEARDGDIIGTFVSGAPEVILQLTERHVGAASEAWHDLVSLRAAEGTRLLLVATRERTTDWVLSSLIAFSDPLRPEIRDAVATALGAGIQVVMVTGDHPRTAAAIAGEAGIASDRVVTGQEMGGWDDASLARELPGLHVVARATPDDKLRLVKLARRGGRTIAVTGDGVNDAPALHSSDVAVAMGSGTAVAREAADLVLGDDSFATFMGGLREGRRMIANVQKGLVFLISTHVALLGFVLVATLAGYAQPLLPIQILWAELFIDLSSSVAFEREREEPGAMRKPPRPRGQPLLDRGILLGVALAGGFSALAALALMLLAGGDDHARWLAFTALAVGQAVRAYANRSLDTPIFRLPPNGFLALAAAVVFIAQAAIPYLPPLADAFRASPLDAGEWAMVAMVALAPAAIAQAARSLGRRWIA
ncbi:MAG TPA: cation-transporting P-type ATPase [Candidatus Limnocylindria bacterium]|nr:cation-transporting P-type ATPase [Candidatus Limnocylindria bacterium]